MNTQGGRQHRAQSLGRTYFVPRLTYLSLQCDMQTETALIWEIQIVAPNIYVCIICQIGDKCLPLVVIIIWFDLIYVAQAISKQRPLGNWSLHNSCSRCAVNGNALIGCSSLSDSWLLWRLSIVDFNNSKFKCKLNCLMCKLGQVAAAAVPEPEPVSEL